MHVRFFGPLLGVMAAALLFSTSVAAVDEGIDYKTLSKAQPTESGDKVEVVELFWYGCAHCYHLEPKLKKWLATKPDYVEFRRMPAVLGRGWAGHGRTYFALEMMGEVERVHEAFFRAMHDEKRKLFDAESIADWLAQQGVDREEFLKAYRSFVVDMKVRKSMQYGQQIGLEGVPFFVVNGKYTTSPSMTAGTDKAFQVITHLAAIEAGEAVAESEEESETTAVEPAAVSASGEETRQQAADPSPADAAEAESAQPPVQAEPVQPPAQVNAAEVLEQPAAAAAEAAEKPAEQPAEVAAEAAEQAAEQPVEAAVEAAGSE